MKKMQTVTDLKDIPAFRTLKEEAQYWDTHQLSPELWAQGQRGDPELDAALNGLVSVKVVSTKTTTKPKPVTQRRKAL